MYARGVGPGGIPPPVAYRCLHSGFVTVPVAVLPAIGKEGEWPRIARFRSEPDPTARRYTGLGPCRVNVDEPGVGEHVALE